MAWSPIIKSTGPGLWSAGATWVGGVPPGIGATIGAIAMVQNNVTMDVNVSLGNSQGDNIATSGTWTSIGTTTLVGDAFTLATTEMNVGDLITIAGCVTNGLIDTITDLNHITLSVNTTAVVAVAATIKPVGLYIKGTAGVILTQTLGTTLTMKGHVRVRNANPAMKSITFDSSAAPSTPRYTYMQCAGGQSSDSSQTTFTGTSGTRVVIQKAVGSANWLFTDGGGGRSGIIASYIDFVDGGVDGTTRAIDIFPRAALHADLDHYRLYRCAGFRFDIATTSFTTITNGEIMESSSAINTTGIQQIEFNTAVGASTGTRIMRYNSLYDPLYSIGVLFNTTHRDWTVEDNFIGICSGANANGNFASFARNMGVQRNCGNNAATNWWFVGIGGDTIADQYFCNDEGLSQLTQHSVMTSDSPTAGTCTFLRYTYEAVTQPATVHDMSHLPFSGAAIIVVMSYPLALPNSLGLANGQLRMRGNASNSYRIDHGTLMTDIDAVPSGSEYAGHAGILDVTTNTLFWEKVTGGGYALSYDASGGRVTNILTAAGISNNAHWNGKSGTISNDVGGAPVATLGYNNFWQTIAPNLGADVDLGSGTNEMTQGPKFIDSTRNLATFTRFLGTATAPAWADATVYAVGDVRSIAISTFYGGASINMRCVAGHTSDVASATKGQPGSTTTNVASGYPSGYRQFWEFQSSYLIRQAIVAQTPYTDATIGITNQLAIKAIGAWVRYGFTVQSSLLATSGVAGTFIGAGGYQAPVTSTGQSFSRIGIHLGIGL